MRFGIISDEGRYFAKRNLDRGENAWGFAWTLEESEALISDDLKYIREVMEQTEKKLCNLSLWICFFYDDSDYNRREYEGSGDAERACTKQIASEMEEFFTAGTVDKLVAGNGFTTAYPNDYPDWELYYIFKMRIRITDQITDDLMNTEKYPLDNRHICIHYLEDEADCIIYTTDLKAVWSVMDYLSDLYYHEKNEWGRTPYKVGSKEAFYYGNFDRSMSSCIYPDWESEDYFVKMSFYIC